MSLDDSARQQLLAALGNRPDALSSSDGIRVRPASAGEVAAVVAWAARTGHRLYPTSSGRASRAADGLVLDLSGLDAIVEVNRDDMLAVAQAGVRVRDLASAAAGTGLAYPPGFLAGPDETVGGALARGAGSRSRLSGPHRDYALGLHVVFGTGEASAVGSRAIKNQTGYNLTQHLIGSWGALAVIVEATLRLVPSRPASLTCVAAFDSTSAAAGAAVNLATSASAPELVELVDRATAEASDGSLARAFGKGESWLLIRLEGLSQDGVAERANSILTGAQTNGAIRAARLDADAADALWDTYRSALCPQSAGPAPVRLELGLPLSAVVGTVDAVSEIASRRGAGVSWRGGLGFGAATLTLDSRRPDVDLRDVTAEIIALVRSTGGSVCLLSGLALDYDSWLEQQLPAANAKLIRLAKSALDPAGVLSPLLT